ncbi:hypothetical protein LPJ66_000493 [Kickxella alabastrina]|uniref:Uncharacterized protein n=1 Tax=Kickxella alabastrina TaxID=61397 RepID=A0ACC1IW05_9FUNG|nr:hypothetical protein LPJ66_000493 [Kickxella alabastrina]
MSGTAANTDTGENRDDMTNSNANLSPGEPSPHSLGIENSTSPLALSTITGGANSDDSFREAIDVAVVSLARYTFADPGVAEAGPAPLDPPIERPRLLGVDQPPLAAVSVRRAAGNMSIARGDGDGDGDDDDGLIAEFTEDRCHRQLAMIAKRLLLPDSYIEACYDLHQFLDTSTAMLDVEAVQRNVFKCLKICARLSKLHGYNIQLMWQIIQQAHRMIARFTPERAHTINLWHIKMTNRIRMMAVAPASDGSAPPRLPSVPPRELLQAQAREKLLPLPEMSVSALNDSRFNRAAGTSSASYYLANSLASQRQSLGQSQTQSQILPPIIPVGRSSLVDTGVSQGAGFNGMMTAADSSGSASFLGSGSGPGSGAAPALALLPPLATLAPAAEPNGSGSEFGFNPGPVSNHYNGNSVSEGAPTASSSTTTTASSASASTSASMREAELAIIEQQLRELENMPPESMGPMLRAALNLLVEMRFRLQLGLPRIAIADGAQNDRGTPAIGAPTSRHHQGMQDGGVDSDMAGLSNPVGEGRAVTLNGHRRYSSGSINANDEVFGANAEDESRVIEYVLNQISTSRRQQHQHHQQQQQIASSSNGFGAPLYMMPHHTGMYYPRNNGFNSANSYLNLFPESQTQTPDNRPRGARRRRGFDDQETQNSQDDGNEDDDISGESEEGMDDSGSDSDSGSGSMSDDIRSLSDINADSSGSSDESDSDHFEQDMQGRGGRPSQHYQRDDEHVHRRVRRH